VTDRPLVLLLRTPREPDPYVLALAAEGFAAACIPVLRFDIVRSGELAARLVRPEQYGGLVATSQRAVEALAQHARLLAPWADRATYAVGPATADAIRRLGLPTVAEEPTAERLAQRIIENHTAEPLLFLAGNRRLDTLPDALWEAGVAFEELEVYRSVPVPPEVPSSMNVSWAVFFSPSGVDAALGSPAFPWDRIRTAAIGDTTAAALRSIGRAPAAVAHEPAPEALARALRVARFHS
jgi:uroporphyrinogen-III synthase